MCRFSWVSVLALGSLLILGCDEGSAGPCSPGEQRACPCAGYTSAVQGVRLCSANGNGFGICIGCPAEIRDAAIDHEASDAPDALDDTCAPPGDASGASLCLTFAPEDIAFVNGDSHRDGKGRLSVSVYDATSTNAPDADATPFATAMVPELSAEEVDIRALGEVRFDNLPAKVSILARFADDPKSATGALAPYTWIGGADLSRGLDPNLVSQTLELAPARGTARQIKLVALRRVVVSVELCACATPLDDAKGPLYWFTTTTPTWTQAPVIMGSGKLGCGILSGGGARAEVEGFVVGAGPHYIFAYLDDFARAPGPFTPAPGALITLPRPSGPNRLALAEAAYDAVHGSLLDFTIPLGDAGALPPRSCP